MNPTAARRVVQIPLEWPMRYGTVLAVSADNPPTGTFIEWDDGRQEWIRDDDFVPLRIWLVSDEKKEPQPKPLEDLLDALITLRRAPGGR